MMSAAAENFEPPPPPPQPEPRAPRPVKLLPIGIAVAAVGLIVLVGGFANFIPGGKSTGAAIGFLGVVLLAFSFIPLPVVGGEDEPLSFFEKVTGIFFEPSRVFRSLRRYPHWFGAFAIIAVLTVIYSFAFV